MKHICFMSCTGFGKTLLDKLIFDGIKISSIISLDKELAEKNNVSGYTSYEDIAKKHNISLHIPKTYTMKSEEDLEMVKKLDIDLLLVMGWNRLIPGEIIKRLKIGGIGVHGSSEKLPKGRGRSPINWSIIEDKKRFITHIFFLDPKVDSGEIIDLMEFDINEFDTCKTVYYKNFIAIYKLLTKNMKNILDGKCKTTKQEGEPSYYPKRTPEDGKIDWNKTTKEIYNLVRAVTRPYPGAFCNYKDKKMYIWRCQPFDTKIKYDAKPGQIVEVFPDSIVVKTSDSTLLLTETEINGVENIEEGIILK